MCGVCVIGRSRAPLELPAPDAALFSAAVARYAQAWRQHFAIEHDPSGLRGERNVFRYRPLPSVLIRVASADELRQGALAVLGAHACGVHAVLSLAPGVGAPASVMADQVVNENEAGFCARLAGFERARVFGAPSRAVWQAAVEAHAHLADGPVLLHGRLELRHYAREQAVSQTVHRYGNVTNSAQIIA